MVISPFTGSMDHLHKIYYTLGVSFIGGIVIISGLAINLIIEKVHAYKNEKERAYWTAIKRIEEEYRKDILNQHEET